MKTLRQFIGVLSTPIAKRKGVIISADDCRIWADGFEKEDIKSSLLIAFIKILKSYPVSLEGLIINPVDCKFWANIFTKISEKQ